MMSPGLAARQFAAGLLLGAALGGYDGLLGLIFRGHPVLRDLLFVPAGVWAWLELMFGVCRGDLRVWNFLALVLGAVLWDRTAGRLILRTAKKRRGQAGVES